MTTCRILRNVAIGVVLLLSPPVFAQGGGEEEGAGNNLSFPTVFAEGIGVTGLPVATDTGLRTPPDGGLFSGAYWLGWLDGATQNVCDPALPDCPPPGASDVQRLYLQNDASNIWQAGWFAGTPGVPVAVTGVDWGDNLESGSWYENSVIRVETVLYLAVDPALDSYEMWLLYGGNSPGEMQGARTSNAENPVPTIIPSPEATVYSPCARLTIQKLRADAGEPVPADYAWDATAGQWSGAAATLANNAVWEGFGTTEGGEGGYSAEVNVGGKLIDGYNWKLRSTTLPAGINKLGWYRLTFSLDATGKCGGDTPIALNTDLSAASIVVSEEEGEVVPAAEPTQDSSKPAVIDATNNLTYIDVYIGARRATCGDGMLDSGEQCDDGNLVGGDCCDEDCQFEPSGTSCGSDGNVCTTDVCNGSGTCTHPSNDDPCDDGDACTSDDTCVAGACVGGPSVTCPACHACVPESGCTIVLEDGTACDDGTACTTGETCAAGACAGGERVTCGPCEICDPAVGCTVSPPRDDCRCTQATNAATLQLRYRKREQHRLGWTWSRGERTTRAEFGLSPEATDPYYDLCVYQGDQLRIRARTQTGSTCGKKDDKRCWNENRRRLRYRDTSGGSDGLVRLRLRDGADGKASIDIAGVGPAFDPGLLDGPGPFTVQLRNRQTNMCWGASHTTRTRNQKGMQARGQ